MKYKKEDIKEYIDKGNSDVARTSYVLKAIAMMMYNMIDLNIKHNEE